MRTNYRICLCLTLVCLALTAGYAKWGRTETAVGFGLVALYGVLTYLVVRPR